MSAPKIITRHVCPPIPTSRFDWMAHYEGEEGECIAVGHGPTEAEAIAELRENHPREDRATEIPMDDCNLSINCGRDGTWLIFSASSGKSAAINVDLIDKGGIVGTTLNDWCADRQKQAEQIRADNGQFGVGA